MFKLLFSAAALKAWLGAVIAALAVAAPLGADNHISLSDTIYIAAAFFTSLGVVFGVSNSTVIIKGGENNGT